MCDPAGSMGVATAPAGRASGHEGHGDQDRTAGWGPGGVRRQDAHRHLLRRPVFGHRSQVFRPPFCGVPSFQAFPAAVGRSGRRLLSIFPIVHFP